jgi:hypothetical protein
VSLRNFQLDSKMYCPLRSVLYSLCSITSELIIGAKRERQPGFFPFLTIPFH